MAKCEEGFRLVGQRNHLGKTQILRNIGHGMELISKLLDKPALTIYENCSSNLKKKIDFRVPQGGIISPALGIFRRRILRRGTVCRKKKKKKKT